MLPTMSATDTTDWAWMRSEAWSVAMSTAAGMLLPSTSAIASKSADPTGVRAVVGRAA